MKSTSLALALSVGVALVAACSSGDDGGSGDPLANGSGTDGTQAGADGGPGDDPEGDKFPFEPLAPSAYVAKVKNLLVGLPPTDAEVQAVTADPKALGGLVDGWMALPQYAEKMQAFFAVAFQQTQVQPVDFDIQLGGVALGPGKTSPSSRTMQQRLLQGLKESFARTAMQLVAEGKPFTEVITTRRFMLTPPLMALYAFIDQHFVPDTGKPIDRQSFTFKITAKGAPIPIADTLNPSSPNYMTWYNVALANAPAACNTDPLVISPSFRGPDALGTPAVLLEKLLYGEMPSVTGNCSPPNGDPQFADNEFDTWKMVTIRPPNAGEVTTTFYDLVKLRNGSELVLNVPRIGFFSTPVFQAAWSTNSGNQARVSLNQTLIVALGHPVNGFDVMKPTTEAALDSQHAAPGSTCYGCHETLDPMRQFFRQSYNLQGHEQTDTAVSSVPASFALDGVAVGGTGVADLTDILAKHPRFAKAWTQKLCYYANSVACSEDDPEFLRVADVFTKSSYSWKVLVREIMISPLTTYASHTKSAGANGVTISIARKRHLCALLGNRLGIVDPCGLNDLIIKGQGLRPLTAMALNVPADGYARGSEAPTVMADPSLFTSAATENVCQLVATQVVDVGTPPKYSSAKPEDAISDFVHNLMAIPPSDPRAAQLEAVLTDHFNQAKASSTRPTSATTALQSTFMLACMSPTTLGIGL